MKFPHSLLIPCAVALLTASCATHPSPFPTLESRQSGEWPRTATRLQVGPNTILYHGEAHRDAASPADRWSGTVTGDIFVIGPQGYVLIPNGWLNVAPNQALSVGGVHRTVIIADGAPH